MRQTVRTNKAECTGCGACVSICPKGAITMCPDEEGFLYPVVDGALCVECNLCEKRCPAGRIPQEHSVQAFGARHKDDEIRKLSSSGGVFTALARQTFAQGGVVFGAVYDENLHVEHVGAFNEAELAPMHGSKYVQSDSTDAIAHAAALLERGIPVLFSGTPCQIEGLLARVGNRYADKLLTVDFVCHGAPSPGVFASYIAELERKKGQKVVSYTFRDKRLGWKDPSAVATFEDGSEHTGTQRKESYFYGFLRDLYLRPSCMQCTGLRCKRRTSDLTIGDLWGAPKFCPEQDDDIGLSLVMVNNRKGERVLKACANQLHIFPVHIEDMLQDNPSIEIAVPPHPKRAAFFEHFAKYGFEGEYVLKLLASPGKAEKIVRRILHLPKGVLRRLGVLLHRGKG